MPFGEEGRGFFQESVLYLGLTYAPFGLAQLAHLGLWARREALDLLRLGTQSSAVLPLGPSSLATSVIGLPVEIT